MFYNILFACALVGVLSLSLQTVDASTFGKKASADIINNTGKTIGKAHFVQGTQGVIIEVKVSGLTSGKHGMHFHKVGTCQDHEAFKMAEGHIDPHKKPHGFLNPGGPHEGNLPNLIVHNDGSANVELYTELVSLNGEGDKPALLDSDGSTIMVHKNPDDHTTQPIGGSGERVACGVIKK